MTCSSCPALKRLLCMKACYEVNQQLCLVDYEIKKGEMKPIAKERRCHLIIMALVLLLIALTAAHEIAKPWPSPEVSDKVMERQARKMLNNL